MAAGNLKLSVILTAITGAFNDNIRSAGQRFRDAMNGLGSDSKAAGSAIEGNLSLGGLVRSVAAIVSVGTAVRALADNAIVVQQLQKQLEFATGGGAQAAAAFALVRDVSNTLGVSLEASAKGFAQLAASTKGTQLEGQATKDLFIGISQAAAVLNLSTEETGGVINALSQIASKGTVQLEELKGQLGDRLPGVLKIAADSMGVTVAELNKMVESGLDANVFLSKFGPALQNAFSAKAAENLATLGGQMNLLKNQFFDLFDVINKAGANNLFATVIKDINALLASVTQAFKEASASPDFAAFGSQLTSAYETMKEVVGQILLTIKALYGTFETVFSSAQQLFSTIELGSAASVEAISPLQAAMLGLNIVVGALADGFKTIQILIQETLGALATVSATVTGTLANAVGLINKTSGDALAEIAKQRQEQARAAFAEGERLAQAFKSSTIAALDATGVAAAATAEKAKAATKDSLAAADAALVKLAATAKAGVTSTTDLQVEADKVSQAYVKLGQTGVLTQEQVRVKVEEVAATLTKASTGVETFLQSLKKDGPLGVEQLNNVSAATAKGVVGLADLAASAKTTSLQFKTAFADLIQGAKTKADLDLINQALASLGPTNRIAAADIKEAMNEIRDAALKIGPSIEQSYQDTLSRVGLKTKEQLKNVVDQATNDLANVRELVGRGELAYSALGDAQAKLSAAQAAATPGVTTLADVTKRLADINRDCADAFIATTKHVDSFAQSLAKSNIESAKTTSAGAGLAGVFNDQKAALLSLSAAAANQFGQALGVQFGYIEAGAEASQSAIQGMRQELSNLTQYSASPDFIGISTKLQQIAAEALKVKIAFAEQKIAADDSTTRIANLAASGTASLAELQKATKLSGESFGLLGKSDLTGLNSALDAAKNRIEQIKNASLSTTQALKAMGDSLEIEVLRAQGNNVAAIQAEAAATVAGIDAQIKALGANASAAALAEANRVKQLLAQTTAQKIAEQKATDAAAAANKKAAADKTPDIVIPPQAIAPQPPATPATAANDPTMASSKQITLRFEDASGKASTAVVPSQQSADDLLAILKRAGATNIAQAGS